MRLLLRTILRRLDLTPSIQHEISPGDAQPGSAIHLHLDLSHITPRSTRRFYKRAAVEQSCPRTSYSSILSSSAARLAETSTVSAAAERECWTLEASHIYLGELVRQPERSWHVPVRLCAETAEAGRTKNSSPVFAGLQRLLGAHELAFVRDVGLDRSSTKRPPLTLYDIQRRCRSSASERGGRCLGQRLGRLESKAQAVSEFGCAGPTWHAQASRLWVLVGDRQPSLSSLYSLHTAICSDVYWTISNYPDRKEDWVDNAGCGILHYHQLGDCHSDECIGQLFVSQGNVGHTTIIHKSRANMILSRSRQPSSWSSEFQTGRLAYQGLSQICLRTARYDAVRASYARASAHGYAG